jgi:tRNA dimethylallyltransferase
VRRSLGQATLAAEPVTRPLLVVAGPTASGKSALGLAVAEALGGEIVSADAFAVYRGLDIGTDKPAPEARRRIQHHLVDILEPTARFSAGDFSRQADTAIADIVTRGVTPVVVGGTHFYLRALLFGLFDGPPRDAEVRARLQQEWDSDPDGMRRRLEEVDPASALRITAGDRQRILRALEVFELTGVPLTVHWQRQRQQLRYRPLLAAPRRERADLYARIGARVDMMFSQGLVAEVRGLLSAGVPSGAHAFKAIGYGEVVGYVRGHWDLDTAVARTKHASRLLAKRQLSWLRHLREGRLHWVSPVEAGGAEDLIHLWHRHLEEGGVS